MFSSIIAAMFLGVGYPPPTEYDVLLLLQKRSTVGGDLFVDPYAQVETYELDFGAYPVDVVMRHCDPFRTTRKRVGLGAVSYNRGYRCLVEVISHALPPFDLSGVFTHDGLQWHYFGVNKPRKIRPQETINRKNINQGRYILKPGSIPYDGNPDNPINGNVPSPYDDLLRGREQAPDL